ncbi:MAG: DUF952 domain-containing protein [Planctomycetota bacterium]
MLYHLVLPGTADPLRPASLESEGFVHLSTAAELRVTLEKYFSNESEVEALEIDPGRLSSELRWEAVPGRANPMPHLYGPLEKPTIVRSWVLTQEPSGWSGLDDLSSTSYESGRP